MYSLDVYYRAIYRNIYIYTYLHNIMLLLDNIILYYSAICNIHTKSYVVAVIGGDNATWRDSDPGCFV